MRGVVAGFRFGIPVFGLDQPADSVKLGPISLGLDMQRA